MTTIPSDDSKLKENIAEWIWVELYQNIGISWGGIKEQPDPIAKNLVSSCYLKTDSILSILKFALNDKDKEMNQLLEYWNNEIGRVIELLKENSKLKSELDSQKAYQYH